MAAAGHRLRFRPGKFPGRLAAAHGITHCICARERWTGDNEEELKHARAIWTNFRRRWPSQDIVPVFVGPPDVALRIASARDRVGPAMMLKKKTSAQSRRMTRRPSGQFSRALGRWTCHYALHLRARWTGDDEEEYEHAQAIWTICVAAMAAAGHLFLFSSGQISRAIGR